ncbi:MAG TPA: hypothetical protein PKA51_07895, partial [Kiritimatiellia bacterium]|nr:hypothetical protein [Kiritimatiellia bacterium]
MARLSRPWSLTWFLVVWIAMVQVAFSNTPSQRPASASPRQSVPPPTEETLSAHPEFMIVRYKSPVAKSTRSALHRSLGGESVRAFNRLPIEVVRIAPSQDRQAVAARYQKQREVLYVEPNYRIHLDLTPNDTFFTNQWALLNNGQSGGAPGADIGITNVWATRGANASNIIVAVIDTGVD